MRTKIQMRAKAKRNLHRFMVSVVGGILLLMAILFFILGIEDNRTDKKIDAQPLQRMEETVDPGGMKKL